MSRNTLLCTGIALALAQTACWSGDTRAAPKGVAAQSTMRLAIVASAIGTRRSAMDIAYPYDITAQQAQADMAALAANTGWEPGQAKVTRAPEATMVHFSLSPGPHAQGSAGLPIWGLILTFRAFTSIEIVYLGVGPGKIDREEFSNRYITVTSRAQGGIASYGVTVRDASFTSAAQLMAVEAPGPKPSSPRRTGAPIWQWSILVLAAVGTAWGAYRLACRLAPGGKA